MLSHILKKIFCIQLLSNIRYYEHYTHNRDRQADGWTDGHTHTHMPLSPPSPPEKPEALELSQSFSHNKLIKRIIKSLTH